MKFFILFISLSFSLSAYAQSPEEYLEKAIDLHQNGKYEQALKQLEKGLSREPKNILLLTEKGYVLRLMEKMQEAYDVYTYALDLDDTSPYLYDHRGLLLQNVGEFEDAIRDHTAALKFAFNDTLKHVILVNRAAAKSGIRNFQGAYDDLMTIYRKDSFNLGMLINLAVVADELGKGDMTLPLLLRVLEQDSTSVAAIGNIGFKYQQMGDYRKSIEYFTKVLKLAPENGQAYSNMSFSKFKLGDLPGALKDINLSIKLYPANSYAFRTRALIYLEQKLIKEACADLQTALDLQFTKMYGPEVNNLLTQHCQPK